MTKQFEAIQAKEMQLNADGSVQLSTELQDLVAGGVSPEETEEDETVANTGCTVNVGCKQK